MRITTYALVAALSTAGLTLTGTAARADTTCGPQHSIEFDTPGFDTDFRVRICIYHGSSTRGAYAGVSWQNGGDDTTDGRRKFDLLDVHFDLRQGTESLGHGSCDLTRRVNSDESALFTCEAVYRESPVQGGWSATGYLLYNVDRDGAGDLRVDLPGSPTVKN